MPNSFSSLIELGEGDKWALSIMDDSPPPLQVDDTTSVLKGMPFDGNPTGAKLLLILMISWCSWNVRGLNSPIKCTTVLDFLVVSTVDFCCILETRVHEENFCSISKRFGDSWDIITNYSSSGIGCVWVM